MAYKTKDLESQALDAIKKYNLFTVEDIVAYIPCSKETFYNHKLHESDSLKAATDYNKIKAKQSMKQKWYKSNNPTLQVALMKLIGTTEDRQFLTQQHVDHTSKGESMPAPQVYMPADLPEDVINNGLPKG